MKVQEFAEAKGISSSRVRALIAAGRIDAAPLRGAWQIDEAQLQNSPRTRRPLSTSSRQQLARALHTRGLSGLTGHDRARTASRMRALRTSPDPTRLLIDWWGGIAPTEFNAGYALVRNALAGDRDRVEEYVHYRPPQYLRSPGDLARVARDERDIAGLSIDELAQKADVTSDFIRTVENARGYRDLGALRRLLRALSIEPTALPAPDAEGPRRAWRAAR